MIEYMLIVMVGFTPQVKLVSAEKFYDPHVCIEQAIIINMRETSNKFAVCMPLEAKSNEQTMPYESDKKIKNF